MYGELSVEEAVDLSYKSDNKMMVNHITLHSHNFV